MKGWADMEQAKEAIGLMLMGLYIAHLLAEVFTG